MMDGAYFWDELHLTKPNHGQPAQLGALGTRQWDSIKNVRGLGKGLAYCNKAALILVITAKKFFDEMVSMGETGEENGSPGAPE